MDLSFVERLIDLVGRAPIRELDLTHEGWRLRLVKGGRDGVVEPPEPARGRAEAAEPPTAPASADRLHVVAAGIAGVFYRAPAPGEPPFVSVGDEIEEGQTLGILEAMKMLSPVEADRAGRIAAILPENGASVEAGDTLFTIARPG